ncbi:PREDICTED: uncharacterized protein LOC109230134 [Nicotiana attenuata]|uniref:uncharacterized protein LOC109230134 n=1 Tax=Nicotiana attenuata TaxID=49451 RepID=UPI000905B80F|nr:PREDICTED: uncharacterized protein LOC109230134 [Nicotiana attenuata]
MGGKVLLTTSVRKREKTMIKKMKNHWDYMKGEWTLFKQLMRGETGLGWDATKNTIMADDDWWERKIKEKEHVQQIKNNLDEEGINVIDDCDKEHFTYLNDEVSDESDDLQNINSVMFPEPSLKRQKSTDGVSTSSQLMRHPSRSIGTLGQIPDILAGSEIYSFTMNMFRKKNNRQIFLGMPTDEARKCWLEFNYQLYLNKNG